MPNGPTLTTGAHHYKCRLISMLEPPLKLKEHVYLPAKAEFIIQVPVISKILVKIVKFSQFLPGTQTLLAISLVRLYGTISSTQRKKQDPPSVQLHML